jgi:hypothetical protein
MKRIALLTVLLLVVGLSLGFAQEFKPSVAWSTAGSASLIWGYDLATGNNGFDNTSAGEFTLTLVPAGAFTKNADAPVYGWITLTTTALQLLNGATPATVANGATAPTAGIVAGPVAISVYGAPGFTYTYAGFVPLLPAIVSAGYATTGAVTPLAGIVGGTTVKYTMADVASLGLNIGSLGDWGVTAAVDAASTYSMWIGTGTEVVTAGVTYTDMAGLPAVAPLTLGTAYVKKVTTDSTAGTAGKDYVVGADVSLLALKGLTLNVGGYYNLLSKMVGFGAQAGFAMAPFSVMFGIDGTDNTAVTTNALNFDMSGSVSLALGKDTIALNMYADNVAAFTAASTTVPLRMDVGLILTDAEGILPGLNASVGVYAYDLLANPANNPMKVTVAETVSYKLALSDTTYVKPFETVYYQLVGPKAYINAGVALGLFPNTVITAEYVAGAAAGIDNNMGIVTTDMAKVAVIKLTTTISY